MQFIQETKKMAFSMHLSEEAKDKLTKFVIDLDGKEGESLQYIILEGDYVLVTITRHIEHSSMFSKLRFMVCKYRAVGNGKFQCLRSCAMKIEQCLYWIRDHVSPNGAMVVQVPENNLVNVFKPEWNDEFPINWSMREGEPFVVPDLEAEICSVMKQILRL